MAALVLLFVLIGAMLAACGGGGDAGPPPKLVVIGNSLTVHPIDASIGWDHVSGMAASDAAHDYAHLTAAALGLPLTVFFSVDIERNPVATTGIPTWTAPIDSATTVVVELGDNVLPADVPDFSVAYSRLLDATASRRVLVCVSTWWRDDVKDAVIRSACASHGGRFVYIGDILPVRQDDVGRYAVAAVDGHPHDWSMAVIASRVIAAAQGA